MRRTTLGLAALAGLLLAAGCVDSKTVLVVEKDGSGTIEQTVYTKLQMPPGMPGQAQPKPSPEQELQAQKEKLEKAAQKMGEGVTLKSVEPLPPRGEWKGVKAVFAFTDIRKVKISGSPGADESLTEGPPMAGPPPAAPPAGPPAAKEAEEIHFDFLPGPTPKLTILFPPFNPPPEPESPGGNQDPQAAAAMEAMLPMLLDGMKIEIQVKVAGTITKTNATYAGKSTVGLMRQDLGALFKDPAAMAEAKGLSKVKDPNVVKEKLKSKPLNQYIKIETQEKVDIEFE